MAATTAQLLIGNPHPNNGGLHTIHKLELTEGYRPAWILTQLTDSAKTTAGREKIWIPTIDHMLDDALLMAAIHAFQAERIIELFCEFSDKITSSRLALYDDLTAEQRQTLYQECRALNNFPKVILVVFSESSMVAHLEVLSKYSMACEVLTPVYSRSFCPLTKRIIIKDELKCFKL